MTYHRILKAILSVDFRVVRGHSLSHARGRPYRCLSRVSDSIGQERRQDLRGIPADGAAVQEGSWLLNYAKYASSSLYKFMLEHACALQKSLIELILLEYSQDKNDVTKIEFLKVSIMFFWT